MGYAKKFIVIIISSFCQIYSKMRRKFMMNINKKYNVVIDAINPDIVIYTNQFYRENELDYYTNETVRVSVASNTILFPCINSKVDPCGMGTFLRSLMLSELTLLTPTPTLIPEPEVFASVIPITVVVVAAGTV